MADIPIDTQIACVRRELRMRATVYPNRVAAGKMRQQDAERETEIMAAVLATLERVRDDERPGLFGGGHG